MVAKNKCVRHRFESYEMGDGSEKVRRAVGINRWEKPLQHCGQANRSGSPKEASFLPFQVPNGVRRLGQPVAEADGASQPLGKLCQLPPSGRLFRRRSEDSARS